MKHIILIAAFLLTALGMQAKPMADVWKQMPDSLIPYLNAQLRSQMVELYGLGLHTGTANALGEQSKIDTLTADFLQAELSTSSTLQLKRLPAAGDSILCMVVSYAGQEGESAISFYSQDWQRLNIAVPTADDYLSRLLVKPDTMTEATFQELRLVLDPLMTTATLYPATTDLRLRLSTPIASEADLQKLKAASRPAVLRWNGERYE